MRRIGTAVLGLVLGMAGAAGAAKVPPPSRFSLVPAQCLFAPGPGPCSSAFTFAAGTATLRSARQPAPTCPRTGDDPTENTAGDVRLSGVTRAGAPFTGQLAAQVDYRTTFSADVNGNCALARVHIETPSLQGTIECRNGRCKGRLYAVACLPKPCADAGIVSELTRFVVFDDAAAALAVPGTLVLPAATDAR